jgi:hypothetical protein
MSRTCKQTAYLGRRRFMKRAYRRTIWRLDAINHALHLHWRPLCDHNDRLIMGRDS